MHIIACDYAHNRVYKSHTIIQHKYNMSPLCAALLVIFVLLIIYYVTSIDNKSRREGMCPNPEKVTEKFNELKASNNGVAPTYTHMKSEMSCLDQSQYQEIQK